MLLIILEINHNKSQFISKLIIGKIKNKGSHKSFKKGFIKVFKNHIIAQANK